MKEYNKIKKELNDKIQFYKEARMPQDIIDSNPTIIILRKMLVERKNLLNKKRGVKMEENTQNKYMSVEFEEEFNDRVINEFIVENKTSHSIPNTMIHNYRNDKNFLAEIVINLTDYYYKPSTDVGDEGPMSMAKDIIASNIKEDMIPEVLSIVRDYYS